MVKKLAGFIGVDTGSIWLGDLCYLRDYPQTYCHGQTITNEGQVTYDKEIKGSKVPDLWDVHCRRANRQGLMYGGIFTSTRYGDGEFPVFIHYDKDDRPIKLEIRLY